MNVPWPIRPHHGLCIPNFKGKGYSEAFVRNMTAVAAELKANPAREVMLVLKPDLLCRECPHNQNGCCETAQKVERYDEKCLALCGLSDQTVLSWQEFEQLVERNILKAGNLGEICEDCCWNTFCQQGTVDNTV